ncbi:DNA sulfur modification protein DndE [bacterium]|nr:DNA sulfur modification protein DndE [bacterium]
MKLTRLRVCEEVDQRLMQMKAKTGLNPNYLCRLGFNLSLNDPTVPNPADYPTDSDREINRYTLTGEWDDYFVALLRERCAFDKLDLETELENQFRAHVNRGVLILNGRMKHLGDLCRLVQDVVIEFADEEENT